MPINFKKKNNPYRDAAYTVYQYNSEKNLYDLKELQNAITTIIRRLGPDATTPRVWKTICLNAGVGSVDSPTFFQDLEKYRSDTIFQPAVATFFDGMRATVAAFSGTTKSKSGFGRHREYTAIVGREGVRVTHRHTFLLPTQYPTGQPMALPGLDDFTSLGNANKYLHWGGAPDKTIVQTSADIANERLTMRDKECDSLSRVGVVPFFRTGHAYFAERHRNGTVSLNDPARSSLQTVEAFWLNKFDPDGDVYPKPKLPARIGEWGWCQTWSFFELECNLMGCAGLHQQLMTYFVPNGRIENLVGAEYAPFSWKLYAAQSGDWWGSMPTNVKDTVTKLVDGMGVSDLTWGGAWFGLTLTEFVRRLAYRYMKILSCSFSNIIDLTAEDDPILNPFAGAPHVRSDTVTPLIQRILTFREATFPTTHVHSVVDVAC